MHIVFVESPNPPKGKTEPAHAQEIAACTFPPVPLWQNGAVSTTYPARLPEPSAAEEVLLARGNNNAEQAVRDHRRSAEDSFVHHHYWSPRVVTGGERKEEDSRGKKEKERRKKPNKELNGPDPKISKSVCTLRG